MKTKLLILLLSLASTGLMYAQGQKDDDSSAPEKIGWKLAAQAYSFRLFTLEEALGKMNELGLKYVELYPGQELGGGLKGKTDFKMDDQTREQLKLMLQKHGIKAVNYGVVRPTTADDWNKLFEFASDLGLETIVSEPSAKDMDLIESLCEKYKINLGIHNHPFNAEHNSPYYLPENVLSVIAGRSPRIGSTADIGHWVRSGIDPLDAIGQLKGRIISLHLKDLTEFGKPEAHDVPWGTGVCNVSGVLHELKDLKFTGVFSIEYEHNWENNMPEIAESIAYFNRVASQLQQP